MPSGATYTGVVGSQPSNTNGGSQPSNTNGGSQPSNTNGGTQPSNTNPGSQQPTTPVAAPAPTVSGTTDRCYSWATIEAGDDCNSVQLAASISFDYLRSLNPEIDSTCSNLQLGSAYCVRGLSRLANGGYFSAPANGPIVTPTAAVSSGATYGVPPANTGAGNGGAGGSTNTGSGSGPVITGGAGGAGGNGGGSGGAGTQPGGNQPGGGQAGGNGNQGGSVGSVSTSTCAANQCASLPPIFTSDGKVCQVTTSVFLVTSTTMIDIPVTITGMGPGPVLPTYSTA